MNQLNRQGPYLIHVVGGGVGVRGNNIFIRLTKCDVFGIPYLEKIKADNFLN